MCEAMPRSTLTHLACGMCGASYDADRLMNLSPCCSRPLLAHYDTARAAATLTPEALRERPASLWRYAEMLPVRDPAAAIDLGEGWTPLIPATRLGAAIGCPAT